MQYVCTAGNLDYPSDSANTLVLVATSIAPQKPRQQSTLNGMEEVRHPVAAWHDSIPMYHGAYWLASVVRRNFCFLAFAATAVISSICCTRDSMVMIGLAINWTAFSDQQRLQVIPITSVTREGYGCHCHLSLAL